MDNPQQLKQGSEAWLKARLGVFTASETYKLICDQKKAHKYTVGAMTYIRTKALEQITGERLTDYSSADMEKGKELEPVAAEMYSEKCNKMLVETGLNVWKQSNRTKHHQRSKPQIGASLDRLILGEKGAIEIKCPKKLTHCKYMEMKTAEDLKKVSKAYYWQIQQQIMVAGLDYVDFVSFYQSLHIKELFVLRVMRNQEDIRHLALCLGKAIQKKEQLIKIYKK